VFLPIGHEDSGTRRRPWITFSIMAICMVAWFATIYSFSQMEQHTPEHYRVLAREYWEAHPELELDDGLALYMLRQDDPDAISRENPLTPERLELWIVNTRLRAEARLRTNGAVADSGTDTVADRRDLHRLIELGFKTPPDRIPFEGEWLGETLGLIPAHPTVHGLFTHMFMHASWGHILGNLLLFFLAAPVLEDRWGRPLFAAFFVTAGVFAGVSHMVF